MRPVSVAQPVGGDLPRDTGALGSLINAKRVKRLLPALLFFVIVCGLAICLVSPDPSVSLYTGIWDQHSSS